MADFTTTLHETIAGYHLEDISAPYFAKVFKGHPNALMPTAGQALARWFTKGTIVPPEGPRVVTGRRMVAAVFAVECYWQPSAAEGKQQSQEDEIAEVMIGLPAAIVALTPNNASTTYTLAGKTVTLVTVEDPAPVFPQPFRDQPAELITLTLEVHARIPEAS